ncbi:hypothetical protein OEA41_010580 [Lepraria neglecta]|uniref:Uncharacterized protein n=1 Tax=Lepraria neglecta TaxID=209136 RepID=A0AAD9Z129_9LECA|nr:hypothetical protein OEA41_010580 [Lepraria neglecta]
MTSMSNRAAAVEHARTLKMPRVEEAEKTPATPAMVLRCSYTFFRTYKRSATADGQHTGTDAGDISRKTSCPSPQGLADTSLMDDAMAFGGFDFMSDQMLNDLLPSLDAETDNPLLDALTLPPLDGLSHDYSLPGESSPHAGTPPDFMTSAQRCEESTVKLAHWHTCIAQLHIRMLLSVTGLSRVIDPYANVGGLVTRLLERQSAWSVFVGRVMGAFATDYLPGKIWPLMYRDRKRPLQDPDHTLPRCR